MNLKKLSITLGKLLNQVQFIHLSTFKLKFFIGKNLLHKKKLLLSNNKYSNNNIVIKYQQKCLQKQFLRLKNVPRFSQFSRGNSKKFDKMTSKN